MDANSGEPWSGADISDRTNSTTAGRLQRPRASLPGRARGAREDEGAQIDRATEQAARRPLEDPAAIPAPANAAAALFNAGHRCPPRSWSLAQPNARRAKEKPRGKAGQGLAQEEHSRCLTDFALFCIA